MRLCIGVDLKDQMLNNRRLRSQSEDIPVDFQRSGAQILQTPVDAIRGQAP